MRIILFAFGKISKMLYELLPDDIELVGFSDNNKVLQGTLYNGETIFSPYELAELNFDYIIICSIYYKDIIQQLTKQIGIERERILVFIGRRSPVDIGNDNDFKLMSIFKRVSSQKIGISLSGDEREDYDLQAFYKAAPIFLFKKYQISCSNKELLNTFGTVIQQQLRNSFLNSINIALWAGLSFHEIAWIRDEPNDAILKGAYTHGIDLILFRGDYAKKLPCVSWEIGNNHLTILGFPFQNYINDVDNQVNLNNQSSGNNHQKLLYIPSPLHHKSDKPWRMDCCYAFKYIQDLFNNTHRLALMNIECIIALPSSDLALLKVPETPYLKLVALDSDCFQNVRMIADLVVTDHCISGLEYTLSSKKVIHLEPSSPDYILGHKYFIKGYDHTSLAYSVTSINELLDYSVYLLESVDQFADKRKRLVDELNYNNNNEFINRLWINLDTFLTRINQSKKRNDV